MTTTLLAIEDSKTMQKVLEITFSGEGFQTVVAGSAQDGLSKLGSASPNIALVDVTLGAVNGYDLCQQIKRQAPHVLVMMLSSKQQPYDKARGAEVGADDFMDKPFDTQQMLEKVKTLATKAPAAAAPRPVAAAAAPPPKPAAPRSDTLAYGTPAPAPVAAQRPAAPAASRTLPGTAPVRPSPAAAPAATPRAAPVAAAPVAAAPVAAAPVAAVSAATAAATQTLGEQLQGAGLTKDQITAVLALSKDVIEQVVWEVVPVLAETLIKEEIRRLTSE